MNSRHNDDCPLFGFPRRFSDCNGWLAFLLLLLLLLDRGPSLKGQAGGILLGWEDNGYGHWTWDR